jgi:hypothetical protein
MRIARLCLVILIALAAATLSAAPKKGGHLIQKPTQNKSDCPYWYVCYDTGTYYECCGGACGCKGDCIDICGGPCDWDNSCPYLD